MKTNWFSLRMRAVRCGRHLSGAERIDRAAAIPGLTAQLTERALTHAGGMPDQVHCTVEPLAAAEILHAALPGISGWQVADWMAGRLLAGRLLTEAGVSVKAAQHGFKWLAEGPAPDGGPMRGAMLIDAESGQRLEPDRYRGVRVSRMDVLPETRAIIQRALDAGGLGHHRVLEALVLAGKVLSAKGLVAELCWSDAADYLTGYVAAPGFGYQRVTPLKEAGDQHGGRVLFVDARNWDRAEFITFLEQRPVLLHGVPEIQPARLWRA